MQHLLSVLTSIPQPGYEQNTCRFHLANLATTGMSCEMQHLLVRSMSIGGASGRGRGYASSTGGSATAQRGSAAAATAAGSSAELASCSGNTWSRQRTSVAKNSPHVPPCLMTEVASSHCQVARAQLHSEEVRELHVALVRTYNPLICLIEVKTSNPVVTT